VLSTQVAGEDSGAIVASFDADVIIAGGVAVQFLWQPLAYPKLTPFQ
jgi:hypothetical protein